jgi:CheY-like chemotaxis protein
MPSRVLVADDDRAIRESLARALELEGYAVVPAVDGVEALSLVRRESFDALVVDVMMPGVDGLAVCRVLRGDGDHTPILMLTARIETPDRVAGLDAGADDYLPKPFELDELLARLRALLRRAAVHGGDAGRPSETLRTGQLRIVPAARHVRHPLPRRARPPAGRPARRGPGGGRWRGAVVRDLGVHGLACPAGRVGSRHRPPDRATLSRRRRRAGRRRDVGPAVRGRRRRGGGRVNALRPRAARLFRRPVIVLTAAVLGLGAAGGITGMALGGIAAASSDTGPTGVSGVSGVPGGHHHGWHDGPFDRD